MRSPTTTARLAGVLYLVMSLMGFFGLMYVPSTVVVHGDPAATARGIVAAEPLFRLGILSDVLGSVVFLVLGLVLYDLFEDVDRRLARLLVAFVAVSATIDIGTCVNLMAPLGLLGGGFDTTALTRPQLDTVAYLFVRQRSAGIQIVSLFWGLWLLPLGVLVIRSGWFPRILGVLLLVACAGWIAMSVTAIAAPAYAELASTLASRVSGLGELAFMAWLIARGARAAPLAHREELAYSHLGNRGRAP
jgi:hypothetical protein